VAAEVIDANELATSLKANGWGWPSPAVVATVDSTNHALLVAEPVEGTVLIAAEQTQGRGRGSNTWSAPAGSSVLMSIALKPKSPVMTWPWIGVLMSLAARTAIAQCTQQSFQVGLKWPNDLVANQIELSTVDHRSQIDGSSQKLGGVLSEVSGETCVVGLGINVLQQRVELPEGATSIAQLTNFVPSLKDLVMLTLLQFHDGYQLWNQDWQPANDEVIRNSYLLVCETIGKEIFCTFAGQPLSGLAVGVNDWGQLIVETKDSGRLELDSALVTNLRRAT
jgi:BirA family biotin operon repressor/biotin-[acetyl-CoA-carboxylase] ligase